MNMEVDARQGINSVCCTTPWGSSEAQSMSHSTLHIVITLSRVLVVIITKLITFDFLSSSLQAAIAELLRVIP
jgi:hypothetical protein